MSRPAEKTSTRMGITPKQKEVVQSCRTLLERFCRDVWTVVTNDEGENSINTKGIEDPNGLQNTFVNMYNNFKQTIEDPTTNNLLTLKLARQHWKQYVESKSGIQKNVKKILSQV